MGKSDYDITPTQDVGCTDYYAPRNVEEEDIKFFKSTPEVWHLLHPEWLDESPDAAVAASPGDAGASKLADLDPEFGFGTPDKPGIVKKTSNISLSEEEKRVDHEPDAPVSPKKLSDLTIPGFRRRRLQHLIKRFQKASLQCQTN